MPADSARYWEVIFPYADPVDRAHFHEGLHKAGFEGVQNA